MIAASTFNTFTAMLDRAELLAALESVAPLADSGKTANPEAMKNVILAVLDDSGKRTLMTIATNRYYIGKYTMEHDELTVEGEGDAALSITPEGVKALVAALKQVKTDQKIILNVEESEITLTLNGMVTKLVEGTSWAKAVIVEPRALMRLVQKTDSSAEPVAFNADFMAAVLKAAKNGSRAKKYGPSPSSPSVMFDTCDTKPTYITAPNHLPAWEAALMTVRIRTAGTK